MRLRHVSLPGDAGICKRYSPPPPPPRRGFGEEDDGAGKCGWHANYVSGVLDDDDDEAARIVSLDGIQLSRGSRECLAEIWPRRLSTERERRR